MLSSNQRTISQERISISSVFTVHLLRKACLSDCATYRFSSSLSFVNTTRVRFSSGASGDVVSRSLVYFIIIPLCVHRKRSSGCVALLSAGLECVAIGLSHSRLRGHRHRRTLIAGRRLLRLLLLLLGRCLLMVAADDDDWLDEAVEILGGVDG